MSEDKFKLCPFCKEQIHDEAIKCKHCQSLLFDTNGSSKTEKLAELVIKSVGTIPIVMTLLVAIAGVYGIKTVTDVQEYSKKAKDSAESIKAYEQISNRLVRHTLDLELNMLINELSIDSKAPKADSIRKELRGFVDDIHRRKSSDLKDSSGFLLASALFAYYDKDLDKATEILSKAEDSANKFRLLGVVTVAKSDMAEKSNKPDEVIKLSRMAYDYYSKAEKMIGNEESQLICKTRANRAGRAAVIGKFEEAESLYRDLINRDKEHLLYYYNVAILYSRWGKLDKALDNLETGIAKGIIEAGDLTKSDLQEDPGFKNLRSSNIPEISKRYKDILKKL